MAEATNPQLKRRQLAAQLRELRQAAKMSIEEVADHLLCSPAKISRMETGQRAASLRDVRDLCALYEVPTERGKELMALARDGRQRAWWESYDLRQSYARYIGFEAAATTILDYKSSIVTGFMQTEAYAYALISSFFKPVDPMMVQQLTQARLQRQQALFERDPLPRVHVLFDETVLHRVVGGPQVMAEQLLRMIDATRLAEVTIQVVPFAVGGHAAVESTFTILEFDEDDGLPSVLHVEDVFGSLQFERDADVERSREIFERSRAVALSPADSVDLMAAMRERYAAAPPESTRAGPG